VGFYNGGKKMKDSRDVLVEFMQGKADKLSEYGIDTDRYFNEEDKSDIMSWELDVADKVVAEISKSIKYGVSGLVVGLCPFCVKFKNSIGRVCCASCGYGMRHGFGCIVASDFFYIENFLHERKFFLCDIFSSDFYKRLWTSSNCEWG
jgi:hypothetical protein